MSNDQPKRSIWPIFVAVFMLIPVLGLLASGPAFWALKHGYISTAQFDAIRTPIRIAAEFCGFEDWAIWYMMFWDSLP